MKFKLTAINDEISDLFEEQVNCLVNNGIKFVELRKIDGKYLFELPLKRLEEVFEFLYYKKIKVSLIDTPIGKGKYSFEKELSMLFLYFKIADLFNCNNIRLFSDVSKDVINVLNDKDYMKYNILIENEKFTSFNNIKSFNKNNFKNCKILFDIENYYYENGDYIDDCINNMSQIPYIHIRDFSKINDKYCYLGEGDLRIIEFLSILNSIDYSGFISIESHLPINYNLSKITLFNKNIINLKESGVVK